MRFPIEKPHLVDEAGNGYFGDMRRLIIVAGLIASAPAAAQECHYENWIGDRAYPEFAALNITYANGDTDYCPSTGVGTGLPYRLATCDSGYEGIYSFSGSSIDADDASLLSFKNDIWYAQCR